MNIQSKILELIKKRGIKTEDEIEEFLSNKPQKTYNPFLLLNMEAGVDLILSTIENDEKICIYGDYDADGITSTSVLLEVLFHLTDNIMYYIPSRFEEGYGLNCNALKKIHEKGTNLVITVDCGSVSCDEVKYAQEIGLKILVTDHHTITDKIADCLVINPKQPGCPYPFKDLAGVGVAFKLAQALALETGLDKGIINKTLDLVAIGTIADIVPLLDENRTIAKYGMRMIRIGERSGLNQLIEAIGLKKENITSQDISFRIAPNLNAAGRIADASYGVKLLTGKDEQVGKQIVDKITTWNTERKRLQEKTFYECKAFIETEQIKDNFLVINLDDAHEGITGIVAGKIKDEYYRPTILTTPTEDGCLKGTGRSIVGINLYNLLKENEELFERFGGHAAACGFTIKKEKINTLIKALNLSTDKIAEENPKIFDSTINVDEILDSRDICYEFVYDLNKLEPFGCGNAYPVFSIEVTPKYVNRYEQRLKFTGMLNNGNKINCILFHGNDAYYEILQRGEKVSIIGILEINEFNGQSSLQFIVNDIIDKVNI